MKTASNPKEKPRDTMDNMRVLAFFNQKKRLFSLEALDGPDRGRIIAHLNEVILRECKFSKNKELSAGVIGIWERYASDIDAVVRKYLGDDEDLDGYSPTFFGELIKYDLDSKKYIIDDSEYAVRYGISNATSEEIDKDNEFRKLAAFDNVAIIYLQVPEEYCEDAGDISGIAYYLKRNKDGSKIPKYRQINSRYFMIEADIDADSNDRECPECGGSGFIINACDECNGSPDQADETGCGKCGGTGYIETICPKCKKEI